MPSQLFLDTSVLLNYVQVWLEGDDGSVAIVEGDYDKFICTTVREELDTRCSTRRQIYIDLRKFVEQEEDQSEAHPIFNYKVLDFENRNPSVPVTDNDRDHLRDLQMGFASIDDDKFYELRKFIRSVKSRKRTVDGEVSIYTGSHKSDLVDDIDSCIDNRQDSLVLAQGAAWRNDNSGDTVVTLDYGDMIDRESDINDAIEFHYSPNHRLNIVSPDAV